MLYIKPISGIKLLLLVNIFPMLLNRNCIILGTNFLFHKKMSLLGLLIKPEKGKFVEMEESKHLWQRKREMFSPNLQYTPDFISFFLIMNNELLFILQENDRRKLHQNIQLRKNHTAKKSECFFTTYIMSDQPQYEFTKYPKLKYNRKPPIR